MSGLASARLQKLERLCFRLAQQFRQLGKNGRDALRLVAREQFAAESATRLLFEIYIGEGLPVQVFHHKTAVQFLDGPGLCYSLQNVKTRPAQVGDKLVTRRFSSGTSGFAAPEDVSSSLPTSGNRAVICVRS